MTGRQFAIKLRGARFGSGLFFGAVIAPDAGDGGLHPGEHATDYFGIGLDCHRGAGQIELFISGAYAPSGRE